MKQMVQHAALGLQHRLVNLRILGLAIKIEPTALGLQPRDEIAGIVKHIRCEEILIQRLHGSALGLRRHRRVRGLPRLGRLTIEMNPSNIARHHGPGASVLTHQRSKGVNQPLIGFALVHRRQTLLHAAQLRQTQLRITHRIAAEIVNVDLRVDAAGGATHIVCIVTVGQFGLAGATQQSREFVVVVFAIPKLHGPRIVQPGPCLIEPGLGLAVWGYVHRLVIHHRARKPPGFYSGQIKNIGL